MWRARVAAERELLGEASGVFEVQPRALEMVVGVS